MDHDENQFIASGALLARHGLLPYEDYPYFHLPYLVFIYGAIFRVSGYLLLSARSFSVACATATIALLFFAAHELFRESSRARRWWFAATATLALTGNPLFMATSGRAWNHDAPTLLTLCGVLFLIRLKRDPQNPWLGLLAGCMVGLSTGLRVTFAPTFVSFAVAIALLPNTSRQTRRDILVAFLLGFVISIMPVIVVFAAAPHQFMFGIMRFPFLNLEWRKANAPLGSMTAVGKMIYPFTNVLNRPATLCVGALFVAGLWVAYGSAGRGKPRRHRFEVMVLLLVLLALFIGVVAPTPSFIQYFYTPIPFEILLALYVAKESTGWWSRAWPRLFGVTALAAVVFGIGGYRGVLELGRPDNWIPVQIHRVGVALAHATNHGRVLTLSPIFPLEGGCDTYEELATGPFAFRVSPLIPESTKDELRFLRTENLDVALNDRPAKAIFLPPRRALDVSFIAYATKHHLPIYGAAETPARPSPDPWEPLQLSLEIEQFEPTAQADDAAFGERR